MESCTEKADCEKDEQCIDVTEGDASDTSGKCMTKAEEEDFKKKQPAKKRHQKTIKVKDDDEKCEDNSDCSDDYACKNGKCVKSSSAKVFENKMPGKVYAVDCTTKRDRCEFDEACELGELCLMDSGDDGYCFPKECADDDFDLKKVVKQNLPPHNPDQPSKKHSSKKHVKYVDCYTRRDRCEYNDQCERGEICLDDSENEGFCLPKECEEYDWDFKKVKKTSKPKRKQHVPKKVKVVDCTTKRDKCETLDQCQVGEYCDYDSEGIVGYCLPDACANYDAKKVSKKAKPAGEIDCTGRGLCEDSGDCELGETCGYNSTNDTQCYPKECQDNVLKRFTRYVHNHHKKHEQTENVVPQGEVPVESNNKVCLDATDCGHGEDCSCKFWPRCQCVQRQKVAVKTHTQPEASQKQTEI